MSKKFAVLEYAASARTRRIRNWICLCGLALILLLVLTFHKPALSKLSLLWDQSQCLRYSDNSNVPVFIQIRGGDWPKVSGEYPELRLTKGTPSFVYSGRVPQVWLSLQSKIVQQPPFVSHGTIFCGELKPAGGESRLVVVDISIDFGQYPPPGLEYLGANRGHPVYRAISLQPATIFRPGLFNQDFMGYQLEDLKLKDLYYLRNGGVRIFAGQAVPSDSSRFEAKVTIGNHEGKIVGKLQADGSIRVAIEGFDDLK